MGIRLLIAFVATSVVLIAGLIALVGYWPTDRNDAAQASAIWTEIYAIGSLLQLGGLLAAALFAYRAWRAADKSALAAETTLADVRRTSEFELRAYLAFLACKPILLPTDGRLEGQLQFENCGSTPAFNVNVAWLVRCCDADEVANLQPLPNPATQLITLGPRQSRPFHFNLSLSPQQLNEFGLGSNRIGLVVQIDYTDVFEKKRKTLIRMTGYKTKVDGQQAVAFRPWGADISH
jgi:hypothetical protein